MKLTETERGFELLTHEQYLEPHAEIRLVQQSSMIGDGDGAYEHPGSSYLWIGRHHHLSRDEVRQLAAHLTAWVNTGSLDLPQENKPCSPSGSSAAG